MSLLCLLLQKRFIAVLRGCALAFLSLCVLAPATAGKPENMTAGEVSLLPEFCPDTMGFRPGADVGSMGPRAGYWFGLMGKSFVTMHHYCYAFIKEHRALAPGQTPVGRLGLLEGAISEYQYVIDFSAGDFVMLPDVYVRMGDTQALLKRYFKAMDSYAEAKRRKPDYWRPYSRWAEALATLNDRKSALAILEDGMRAVPADPTLRAQYKRLGGDPIKFTSSLPRPVAPPEAAAAASAASSAASAPPPAAAAAASAN